MDMDRTFPSLPMVAHTVFTTLPRYDHSPVALHWMFGMGEWYREALVLLLGIFISVLWVGSCEEVFLDYDQPLSPKHEIFARSHCMVV
jgi:hypothetical protein